MKKVNLTNKRDFPLSTNALKFMQEAYGDLEQLVKLGGDNYILSGCVVTGASVSNGWIVIGGNLMPFNGGTIQTKVRVIADTQIRTVGGGTREELSYSAEFGTSTNPAENIDWDILKNNRVETLLSLDARLKAVEPYIVGTVLNIAPATGYSLPDPDFYYIKVRKFGKVVTLNFSVKCDDTSKGVIGVLPVGLRPAESLDISLYTDGISNFFRVSYTGNMIISYRPAGTDEYRGTVTWLIP